MNEAQPLSMEVKTVHGVPVIELWGEINSFAQQTLEEAYNQAEALAGNTILLDFSRVDYINSTGIALIVNLLRRARASDRKLLASGLSKHYEEIFEITRLSEFIPMFADLDQALAGN
jgi:anti-sigma B factor antagonist